VGHGGTSLSSCHSPERRGTQANRGSDRVGGLTRHLTPKGLRVASRGLCNAPRSRGGRRPTAGDR
jgi:hypothetical protein